MVCQASTARFCQMDIGGNTLGLSKWILTPSLEAIRWCFDIGGPDWHRCSKISKNQDGMLWHMIMMKYDRWWRMSKFEKNGGTCLTQLRSSCPSELDPFWCSRLDGEIVCFNIRVIRLCCSNCQPKILQSSMSDLQWDPYLGSIWDPWVQPLLVAEVLWWTLH